MTNETAPERVFAVIGYRGYDCTGTVHVTAGEFHTIKGAIYGKSIEYVRADALEAAQARIAELEGALRLAEADITYAFERFGFPKERSSALTAIRAALEGKG